MHENDSIQSMYEVAEKLCLKILHVPLLSCSKNISNGFLDQNFSTVSCMCYGSMPYITMFLFVCVLI